MGTRRIVRARRSARQWAQLVEEWCESGLSSSDFAAQHDVRAQTLSWWKWRLATRETSAMSPVRLVPLEVAVPDAVGECELVTAGGHVLRMRGATVEHLATMLSALGLSGRRR